MWNDLKSKIQDNRFAYTNDYLENAENLLNDEFVFQHVYNMEPSPIKYKLTDWFISPNKDPEWLFVLKRQEYLQDLVFTSLYTDDDKYLLKAKYYIFEWLRNNYLPEEKRFSTWRPIDTGIRLLNWAPVYNLLIEKGLLSSTEITQLTEVVNEQANYLQEHYIEKYDLSNWGVLVTTGILVFDAKNPGIIEAKYVEWAEQKFQLEIDIQVDSDGIHWEQSPLYFIEVFRSSLCVLAAKQTSSDNYSFATREKLSKMLISLEYQTLPNGLILQQGDTDGIPASDLVNSAKWIIHGIESEAPLDFLPYELMNEKYENQDSSQPLAVQFDANVSGNFYLKDANNYLHLFNGKLGSGHGHAANTHVDLTINSTNILVDPGRFTYVDGEIRRELKSASSHNVILIDGKYPIVPKDSWKFSEVLTNLSTSVSHTLNYDSYKMLYMDPKNNNYVCRYVVVNKNHFGVVVIDVVKADHASTIQNNWILGPDITDIKQHENSFNLNGDLCHVFLDDESYVSMVDQKFSKRYNELTKTTKLVAKKPIKQYAVTYSVFGEDVDGVTKLDIRQAGGDVDLQPENCFGLKVHYQNGDNDDLVLQHLNTFKGNKLFYVDGHSSFGELNIFDENNNKTFIF